jgi:hypothetical protein
MERKQSPNIFSPSDRALLWVLLHGLRAREVEALNVGDFDGKRVNIREAKDDSVGQVPLLPEAVETLEIYLYFRRCWGEAMEPESPLFLSASNNSKGDHLGYWGIFNVVKDLAKIAGVKDAHPHQGRHTVATEMVSRGMDPLLARQITQHKSEKSFERYSKRSLQKQAEAQFLGLMGEGDDRQSSADSSASIEGTANATTAFVENMGINHGCFDLIEFVATDGANGSQTVGKSWHNPPHLNPPASTSSTGG